MPSYTGTHRRKPLAAHRHARSNWTMAILTGIILAIVLGIAAYFLVRHGVVSFMNGS